MSDISNEQIIECYRRIAVREPGHEHGDFLTFFAGAVIRADFENFTRLHGMALELIQRSRLPVPSPEEAQ